MFANSVNLRFFMKSEEISQEDMEKVLQILPFDLKEEKIPIKRKKVYGFNQERIEVIGINLTKQRHIRHFLELLKEQLPQDARNFLLLDVEKRMDEDGNFFLRLDLEELTEKGEFKLTNQGNCLHIGIKIATFPKSREEAIEKVKDFF